MDCDWVKTGMKYFEYFIWAVQTVKQFLFGETDRIRLHRMRGKGMLILVCYDVNTETSAGKTRLRKIAKECVNYGSRVQNSVFECILDNTQYLILKNILSEIIDEKMDSLRFYNLGNSHKGKVEQIGRKQGIQVEEALIF